MAETIADLQEQQRRAVRARRVRDQFVNIGAQKERWVQVKSSHGCKSDEEVAKLLIKSLYQFEKKTRLFHSGRRRKRSVFRQGQCRVVMLRSDVWSQWRELKHLLQIDSNSQLATVLLEAWYDRADHLKGQYNTEKAVSEYVLSDSWESVTLNRTDSKIENKSEKKVWQSFDDPDSDKEMKDISNHAPRDICLIKLNVEDADYKQDIRCRKSSRMQARGFRPNYANMDWKGESDTENIGEKSDNLFEQDTRNEEGTWDNSLKIEGYCSEDSSGRDENTFIEKITSVVGKNDKKSSVKREKKKSKKDEIQDPDFVVSDNDLENINDSDEDTTDLDYSDSSDDEIPEFGSEATHIETEYETSMQKCKRKKCNTDNLQIVKCKRKRSRNAFENKSDIRSRKKSKAGRKIKKATSGVTQNMKKPWMHIKLEDHQEKYRMEIVGSFERKNRNSNLTEELYTCMLCGRFKSTARDIFEEHIEKHVNMVLECDQCKYVGRSEVELKRHKVSSGHMRTGQEYMCDICGMVLYTWDSRLSHMGKEHNDPQFKCKFCEEKFVTRLKRQQHSRKAHAEVAQYCNSCKADCQSLTQEEFRQHKENCKPGHQCQLCGVVLASRNGLSSHLKSTHMGVRKYQCNLCPYAGKSSQRLKEHVMTHTSVHPYSCDKCTFTCVQACQLKSHMRTHSGEKPFKCTRCKFAAAWNVQLKCHLSFHDLESSVTCRQCDVLFKNEKALKMHEKKVHCAFSLGEAEKMSS